MPNAKILISLQDDSVRIPDLDFLAPIQVGCALTDKRIPNILHDDDGENISEKNEMYCELTALYWAWKNLDADYIGLFHYRRYLSFSPQRFKTNYFGDVLMESNGPDELAAIGMTSEQLDEILADADVVLPERGGFVGKPTMRQQFLDSWQLHDEDLATLDAIITEKHPQMAAAYEEYMNSTTGYFCNMMIMRMDLFDDYCEWLFGILEEHERRSDYSDYSIIDYRVSGYIAERLLGVYVEYLRQRGDVRIKEVQKVFFEDVRDASKPKRLEPAFSGDAATVVLAADDHYVPYLSALLQSMRDQFAKKRSYDIIVFTRDISPYHQEMLRRQVEGKCVSLRFYDVSPQMGEWAQRLNLRGHFQIETYYRLLMQDILLDWDKVVYLDSDMICLDDVGKLYDVDVDGYLLAAVKDADTAGLYNGYDPARKDYMDNELGIKSPYDYFQAGVIVFNLKAFRETFDSADLLEFAASRNWKLLDQDVLNFVAQGCVKYLPERWNVLTDWRGLRIDQIIKRAPKRMYEASMEARKNPAIVHFAGPEKPWNDVESDLAYVFWNAARKTPCYEVVLKRMLDAKGRKGISDATWKRFYPLYTRLFPDRSRRREVMAHIYRKLFAGKKI